VELATAPTHALADALRAQIEPHLIPDAIFEMPPNESTRMKPSRATLAARLAAGERFKTLA
jgi:hypothetical protein